VIETAVRLMTRIYKLSALGSRLSALGYRLRAHSREGQMIADG
jgi:hypothetical protein